MERVALLGEETIVGGEQLGLALPAGRPSRSTERAGAPAPPPEGDDVEPLLAALDRTGWNVSLAARHLGISRNAIRYRMEKHGLRPGQPRPGPPRAAAERPTAPVEGEPATQRWSGPAHAVAAGPVP